jgi:Asp-tRNA(Asn)/Glu-tRNA(Gln) amidotransferase A subunit family amidase
MVAELDEGQNNKSSTRQLMSRRFVLKVAAAAGAVGAVSSVSGATDSGSDTEEFDPIEASIAEIRTAIVTGQSTAEKIVSVYLDRIDAYNDELNAIITVNSDAVERAAELDAEFSDSGLTGPLHGVPMLLKDNYDTGDLPTTAGSVLLEGSVPPNDGFLVEQLRNAGGIVLAKANLGEFAFGDKSSLGGQVRNPYELDRSPGGSSAGTGAGIAANLGAIGTGSDTGGSIRTPSSHNNLVGIRPTLGLLSRDGIVPLSDTQDTGGPMTRTVTDAAIALDAMAGYDPADQETARSIGNIPEDGYTSSLDASGIDDTRIGVLRELIEGDQTTDEVLSVFEAAIADLKAQGATIVEITDELKPVPDADVILYEPNRDINAYFDAWDDVPVETLDELVDSGTLAPDSQDFLEDAVEINVETLDENVDYLSALSKRSAVQELLLTKMADEELDAVTYPAKPTPPAQIGEDPAIGDIASDLSQVTGFPAITVPAGFTENDLPSGIEFLGRVFSEPALIEIAYSYEQATMHRRPSEQFGPLD